MHTMSKYKYFFGVKMALKHLNIFVATMTGTALMVAEDISDFCSDNNIDARVKEMDNLRIEKLIESKCPVLIASSTYGQGDVPDNGQNFYNNLKKSSPNLSHIKYSVFGLGDMTYRDTFAYGGKKFDNILSSLKAEKIAESFYHDASDGSLPEEVAVNWFQENILKLI